MNNTYEEVVYLDIAAGHSSANVGFVPPEGAIVRVKIFHGTIENPGMVNASIEDNNKQELSKMQHIDNYRDRDSSYLDCKPFYYQGGRQMYFKVQGTEAFDAPFTAQLILIYMLPAIETQIC